MLLSTDPVQSTIWHCLNNYAYSDAIFLAERLNASDKVPDENNDYCNRLHLLATAYYRSNNKLQCYDVLKNNKSNNYKCRFLLANACFDLNKLPESEQSLIPSPNIDNKIEYIEKTYNEIAPFVLKLYGKICTITDRVERAKECFQRALKLNPFLWECFELLCKSETIIKNNNAKNTNVANNNINNADLLTLSSLSEQAREFYCHGNVMEHAAARVQPKEEIQQQTKNVLHPRNTRNNTKTQRNLFTSTPMQQQQNNNNSSCDMYPLSNNSSNHDNNTPSSSSATVSNISPIVILSDTEQQPPRPKKPCLRSPWQQQQQQQSIVRRSSRLIFSGNNSTSGGGANSGSHLKENNKNPTPVASKLKNASSDTILNTMREIGKAHVHMSNYECAEAIDVLTSLKLNQQGTPWVCGAIAKCYYEMAEYEKAVSYYKKMQSLAPNRLTGLEWMSTALWHLQREVDLSVLAQDLLSESENRLKPETWIVLGNCFSLQKEHEQSIKFFKRAIQVGSTPYAYTLLGHEYVTTEELEKALRCFRTASRLDPSHYNSWYGMGMIYYKQERFSQAEIYYKKALLIHPYNSVLLCHLGVVQNALSRTEKSLQTFAKALKSNPSDPLCKFHRASVLFAVNRLDESLVELEELKRIVPKESLVHFLIAKIYSKKGDTHKALLHFSWATDLDPKGANNHIKESIEPVLSRANNNNSNSNNVSLDNNDTL